MTRARHLLVALWWAPTTASGALRDVSDVLVALALAVGRVLTYRMHLAVLEARARRLLAAGRIENGVAVLEQAFRLVEGEMLRLGRER